MNRRSLLLLLALLCLSCAGLFALLGRHPAEHPVEGGTAVELPLAGEAPAAELQAEAGAEARSERSSPHLGTPRTPARGALGADAARVAGWLRPQEDKPWQEASVALLAVPEGGLPTLLAESRCEPDGGFALPCTRAGRALFVVLARGYLPRAQEIELALGHELLLEDFDLERGVSIAGALSSNAQPLARFEVVAIDERDLPVVKLEAGELLCNGPGFDWHYTTAESAADGRYSIGGLHPGDYSVRVSTCRGPMASLCASDRSPRRARAPRADVDFAFESGALALSFTSAGQPLADVEVELACGSWRSGKRSDARGLVSFQLVPRLDCTLVASKQGYEPLQLPVTAPASGAKAAESFEMRPRAPAPEVRFLVSSPRGEAPRELRVRLFRQEDASALVLDQQLRCTPASAASPVKEFVLAGAQPGKYRAVLIPGQPWNNELEPASYIGTHCASEQVLEVPAQGELRQNLSTDRRAALRLAIPDGERGFFPARCTLRDASGAELPIVLVDPAQGIPLVGHQLSTLGPTLVYSTLCFGNASLSVEDGDRLLYNGNATFVSGQVTPFQVAR